MKTFITGLLFLSSSISFAMPDANSILTQARDRDDGASYSTQVTLKLYSSDGDLRERHLYMLQKDLPNQEERALMHFHSPADVRGVSFLIANYDESTAQPDDQWMYLPAFRKTRRLGSNDKRGSFMGSTFNYSDLDKIRVNDYQSTLLGEEEVLGRPTWVIERVAASQEVINKTGYHKTKVWIDKERDVVMQQHYYNAKGIVFKTQQSTVVEQVQGVWTIMTSEMVNLENGKRSEMIFSDVEYNVALDDKLVSKRSLKQGISPAKVPSLR